MNHPDDIALAKAVLAKEPAAFELFFDTYFGRLYRFCNSRIGDPQHSEDIVQETLCKGLKGLGSYRGEAALFSWLCQICRHEISDWYRSHEKKMKPLVSLDDDPAILASLESFYAAGFEEEEQRQSLKKLVQLTLDYLPHNYGRVLEWKYLEGLSIKEIAQTMDIGAIAVQSLLARARTAFRKSFGELQHQYIGSTS